MCFYREKKVFRNLAAEVFKHFCHISIVFIGKQVVLLMVKYCNVIDYRRRMMAALRPHGSLLRRGPPLPDELQRLTCILSLSLSLSVLHSFSFVRKFISFSPRPCVQSCLSPYFPYLLQDMICILSSVGWEAAGTRKTSGQKAPSPLRDAACFQQNELEDALFVIACLLERHFLI